MFASMTRFGLLPAFLRARDSCHFFSLDSMRSPSFLLRMKCRVFDLFLPMIFD